MENSPAPQTVRTCDALLGPPALIEGESSTAYDGLLARISGAVNPADILEEIWVRDVVDLVWETFRLRRLKTHVLVANAPKGLNDILETIMEWEEAKELVDGWAKREATAIEEVNRRLASAGLNIDAVMAQTLSLKIDEVDRIDRMIMSAETRRSCILRELDRHRATLAQKLRRASQEFEEAQFEEVGAARIEDRSAA